MNSVTHLVPGIRAFRPFLPAKDYATSLRFYEAVGFKAYPLGEATSGVLWHFAEVTREDGKES